MKPLEKPDPQQRAADSAGQTFETRFALLSQSVQQITDEYVKKLELERLKNKILLGVLAFAVTTVALLVRVFF